MTPNQMNKLLCKTKVYVADKTKDLGAEFTKACAIPHQYSIQNAIVVIVTAIVIMYFICMDILTYVHLQEKPVRTRDPTPYTQGFDYFQMLSIKGMMEDQLSCHINWPTVELFEMGTSFSQLPGVTPSRVSLFGAIIAIPAAKLLSMESLTAKRIGIVIFMFRLWIDGLDGVVFRMQHLSGAEQHTQQSSRHTTGWLIDFLCDSFAGMMFLVGAYHSMKQSLPRHSTTHHDGGLLPMSAGCHQNHSPMSSPRSLSPSIEKVERDYSNRTVHMKLMWVVIATFFASGMWDYFASQYRSVFEVTLPTLAQQEMQNVLLKSNTTCLILWCWRLLNGVSLINTAYLAVAYDKLWEYVYYMQLLGTPALLILSVTTMLHLSTIHNALAI